MTCRRARRSLALGADAGLDPAASAGLERHLARCPACRAEAAQYAALAALVAALADAATWPGETVALPYRRARLLAALPERPLPRPRLGWRWLLAAAAGLLLGWVGHGLLVTPRLAPLPARAVAGLRLSGDRLLVAWDPLQREPVDLALSDPRVAPLLLQTAAETSNTGLRLDALAALGALPARSGDAIRATLLRALANDPNPAVRLQAVASLTTRLRLAPDAGAPGWRAALAGLRAAILNDPNAGVRSRAVAALAAAPPAQAVALLEEVGGASADPDVRDRCAVALRGLNAAVPASWLDASAGAEYR